MYHEITPEMTIGDLVKSKAYGPFADYIFTDMAPDHWNCPLKEYGMDKVGFIPALHRMEDLTNSGNNYVYQIYSEEECLSEWDKAKATFLHFPGPKANKPYAVVIPGGGFNRQWGLIEGMVITAKLNELGYTAFVLYYRTKQEPLMPKPIEDMYRCIRYIEDHADDFQIQAGHYMIGGFSAGATIAGEIGSTNLGWQTGNISKPEMVFLGYTAIRMNDFYDTYQAFPVGHPVHEGSAPFLRRIGGPEFTQESIAPYNLADHVDHTYPPVYITANEDDGTVPVINSHYMDDTCPNLGIPHKCKFGAEGGHSFGLGIGLEVDGWLDEAVDYWNEVAGR